MKASFWRCWNSWARMPLPPYIKEELQDGERYQTVYSKVVGSAAAPTAGLHFTPELLENVQAMGVKLAYVTLHVGLGTFRPVKEDDIAAARYARGVLRHPPGDGRSSSTRPRRDGGRVICVGTTSCRTIESFANRGRHAASQSAAGRTSSSTPATASRCMDALITNFHLPEVHPHHAGLRSGRTGTRAGRLRRGGAGALPVLQLRGRHVHLLRKRSLLCLKSSPPEGKARRGQFTCAHGTAADTGVHECGHPGRPSRARWTPET